MQEIFGFLFLIVGMFRLLMGDSGKEYTPHELVSGFADLMMCLYFTAAIWALQNRVDKLEKIKSSF